MIAIRNVTKEFDVNKQKVTALSDVKLYHRKRRHIWHYWFSGAGKSTTVTHD